jgi:hypothetical protein
MGNSMTSRATLKENTFSSKNQKKLKKLCLSFGRNEKNKKYFLLLGHFANWSFSQQAILPTGHFANWQFCQQVILPTGHFANWSFCQLVKMPNGHLTN